jgi:malate/lactate dehydrogenase
MARADVARRVVLVDDASPVAQGLALDIRQAGPVNGASTIVEGTSDLGAVVGAAAVVVADRHGKGEWTGDDGLTRVAAIRTLNRHALVVCAGAAQADLIDAMVRERDADRRRLVGSAPEALRSAATALVALEADAASRDVLLAVVGRPPRSLFAAWDGASVGGSRALDVLAPPVVSRLDARLSAMWPPGPRALAAAAVGLVARVLTGAPGWSCVLLVPPADRGPRTRAVAVPAALTARGVEPRWAVLSPRDRVRLESVLET